MSSSTEENIQFEVVADPFDSPDAKTEVEHLSDSRWLELARINFNETPGSSFEEKIKQLHKLAQDQDFRLPRTDDRFFRKILRAGGGDVARAFEVLTNYLKFIKENGMYFAKAQPSLLADVYGQQINTMLEHRDKHGRRVYVYRPGRWNPDVNAFTDLFSSLFVLSEMVSEETKTQIAGITVVADASDFGLKQLRNFSVTDSRTMSSFIQDSFPLWFREIHIVNAPRLFHVAFAVVKTFMNDYIRNNVHFHSQVSTLHEFVDREGLPEELGGCQGKFDNSPCVHQADTMEQYFVHLKNITSQ